MASLAQSVPPSPFAVSKPTPPLPTPLPRSVPRSQQGRWAPRLTASAEMMLTDLSGRDGRDVSGTHYRTHPLASQQLKTTEGCAVIITNPLYF